MQDVFGNKWLNQTGSDYSTNPAGVNPLYVKYLASAGVLGSGDPLNTTELEAVGGKGNDNFNKFFEIVFPQGANDCDLQAAIQNITDKINQFQSMIDFTPNGLKGYVQQDSLGLKKGGCKGCQGDAHAYISTAHSKLVQTLNKYNAIYNKHVQAGGGCSNGILTPNYTSLNQSQRDFDQQLAAKMRADEWNLVEGRKKALAALQLGKYVIDQQTNVAGQQGVAAGTAAFGAAMPPMKILMYVLIGVVGVGTIAYFATRHKTS